MPDFLGGAGFIPARSPPDRNRSGYFSGFRVEMIICAPDKRRSQSETLDK